MHEEDRARAVATVRSIATSLRLRVDDAVVLSDSNRLVLHLLPSDIVARVASIAHFANSALEVDLATQLAGCPIAGLDPRVAPQVFVGDDFEISFWEYFEAVLARKIPTAEYLEALVSLHAGLRRAAIDAPHVSDRIAATLEFVTSRHRTPDLADEDRTLLASTLRDLARRSSIRPCRSNRCTASHIPGTCSTPTVACGSSTSRTPASDRSSTTSHGYPTTWRRTTGTATRLCSRSAERSCSRSSQRIDGAATTAIRAADDQAMRSSMHCATAHPGRHSIRSPGDHRRRPAPCSSAAQPAVGGAATVARD